MSDKCSHPVPLDEIPNQLRLRASRKCADGYAIPFDSDLDNLAADEITRLRLELAEARRALEISRFNAVYYKDGVLIAAFDQYGRQIHAHKVITL